MKGDFSRHTFDRHKNYCAVRMQQGRVLLDADWNEMVDIINEQHTTALRNMIGAHGGLGDGFKITLAVTQAAGTAENTTSHERSIPDLSIGAGQYFANGYLCTLAETISYEHQPYFPDAATHKKSALRATDSNQWILYLEAWERHLTTIEDPDLAEPSLGGADTTTRTKLVWQIRMLPLKETDQPGNPQELDSLPEWKCLIDSPNNSIDVKSGYATENELYRIEIHSSGEMGQDQNVSETNQRGPKPPTWKWSRDNASIAFSLQSIERVQNGKKKKESHYLQVTLAADRRLQEQLRQGDFVELECDAWILNGVPGWLGRVDRVESVDEKGRQRLVITVSRPVTNDKELAFLQMKDQHPLLRRWDRTTEGHKGAESGFDLLKVKSILQLDRSTLEILVVEGQPTLYQEDWVDLSGLTEAEIWHVAQVQEVSVEGELQKIRVALLDPLSNDRIGEEKHCNVELRRWNNESNLLIPNENQDLEHGITVQFPPGRYKTGDHWLIPIRSAANPDPTRSINVSQANTIHTYAPLALLTRQGAAWEIKDLRRVFIDLGDAFTRLESLQVGLKETNEKLAALQAETDREDEEQETEISTLQKELTEENEKIDQLDESVDTLESKIRDYIGRFPAIAWLIPLVFGLGFLLAYLLYAQGNQSDLTAALQRANQTAIAQNAAAIQQANEMAEAQQATAIAMQQANQTAIAHNATAIQQANQTAEAQQATVNAIQTAIATPRLYIALNPTLTNTVAVVVGNGSGTAFTKSCPPNFVATGFSVWTENFVNAMQLWCSPLFEDSTIGGSSAVESFVGRLSGKETQLMCHPKMMVAGISGRSGQTTDKLQVHCASLDGVQNQDLPEVGGNGGDPFEKLKCPDHFVMTGITGLVNAQDVTRLNMICTAYVTK